MSDDETADIVDLLINDEPFSIVIEVVSESEGPGYGATALLHPGNEVVALVSAVDQSTAFAGAANAAAAFLARMHLAAMFQRPQG